MTAGRRAAGAAERMQGRQLRHVLWLVSAGFYEGWEQILKIRTINCFFSLRGLRFNYVLSENH